MKILLAATNVEHYVPLEQLLLPEGVEPLVKTTTALRVLDLLKQQTHPEKFDIIMLEAALCQKDDFRVIERIRDDPCCAHIPLLLLVPEEAPEWGEQGMLAGASDFCMLQDNFEELVLRLKMLWRGDLERRAASDCNIVLQKTLDAMPSIFIRLSSTGRILEANRAFRQATGKTRQQTRDTFLFKEFLFNMPEALQEESKTAFATGTPRLSREIRIEFSPGFPRWYLVDLIPVQQYAGRTQSLLFFANDITKSKITAGALKESETRYRNLFERLPVSIIEQDFSSVAFWLSELRARGIANLRSWLREHPEKLRKALRKVKLVNANEMSFSLLGVRSEYQFTLHAERMLYGLHSEIGLEQVMALWDNTTRIEFETRIQTLGGTPVHCIAKFFVVEDYGGQSSGNMILVLLDVTKLKRAEEVLRRSEARYRAIVEDQTELICRFLPEGKLSFVNGVFARSCGATPEQLTGSYFPASLPEQDARRIRRKMTALTPDNPVTSFENRLQQPNGEYRWQQWTLRAIYNEENTLKEYQAVGQDITWRKQIENELHAAKEAAEQASHIKSTFLATVSHEIRTPLTAILGYSELLLAGTDLPPDALQAIRRISQAGDRLLALINDVLDLSKIEADKLEIEENDFSLRDVIMDVVDMFLHRCEEKGVALRYALDPAMPAWAWGSEKRLHQVLSNLLSNAVKFTEQGEVRLTLRMRSDWSAEFTVSDTGIGIAPERLESIFNHFTQAGSFVTRKYGGTGLGLSISKRLVSMMGGRLTVRSEPGKGSSFHFDVALSPPHCPRPAATNPETLPRRFHNLNILLVDDDRSNIELAKAFLEHRGHRVETADNGARAVELRMRNVYDLILMDVQMSPMDGMEATRRIRDWEKQSGAQYTPIIALTAHAMKGDRERFLRAGMDGYGSKPFNFKKLVSVINEVLTRARDADGCLLPCPGSPGQQTPLPGEKAPAPPEAPFLDMEQVLANMSRKFWLIGARVFLEDTPRDLETLGEAVCSSQFVTVRDLAHKLKGASGNVGASRMHRLCLDLENAAANKNAPLVNNLQLLLLESWRQTESAISAELML